MSLLEKLAVNKKITAFFVEGSQKMNLGISAAAALLNGADRVPVHVAPVQRASRLLTELAEKSSLTVEKAPEGVSSFSQEVLNLKRVLRNRSWKFSQSRLRRLWTLSRSRRLLSRSLLRKRLLSLSRSRLFSQSRLTLRRSRESMLCFPPPFSEAVARGRFYLFSRHA
jgi:hypothetical protein